MCEFWELQKCQIVGTKAHDESKSEKLIAEAGSTSKGIQGRESVYNTERERAKNDREEWERGALLADECVEHINID